MTICTFSCNSAGGAYTLISVKGFRGDPTNPLPTDLLTIETTPVLPQE